jgi:hypothetical protein
MPEMLTPSKLWKQMTPAQRSAAARAFWIDDEATNEQVQAAFLIAERKKFRAKTVIGLDIERKVRHLASLPSVPDAIAGRALVLYHLAEQRPMMAVFLDALGLAHENGLIQDDNINPDASKIQPAADELAKQFPPEDVQLYLNTLLCQDPETWAALDRRAQLQS